MIFSSTAAMGRARINRLFRGLVSGSADTCPACGSEFRCGVSLKGCWCRDVELPAVAFELAKARYEKCLCRACLEKLAEESRAARTAEG